MCNAAMCLEMRAAGLDTEYGGYHRGFGAAMAFRSRVQAMVTALFKGCGTPPAASASD